MPSAQGITTASPEPATPTPVSPIAYLTASIAKVASLYAAGTAVPPGTLLIDPTTRQIYGQSNGVGGYSEMGGGGGGSSYLGAVADTASLAALSGAVIGSTANVGSGAGALLYELKASPATITANWQPLQGPMPDGTLISVELVAGKQSRKARVYVPIGNVVVATVGGVARPALVGSVQPYLIDLYDQPGSAAPTSVTFQRISGSDATGWYSIEEGSAGADVVQSDIATYAALLGVYPENGAALLALPAGSRVYVEDQMCGVRRSANGKFWIPDVPPPGPRFTGSNAHWIGAEGVYGLTSSAQHLRKWIKPIRFRMPGFRPGTISRISLYQATAGAAGAGTDSCSIKLYPCNPDGSPIIGAAPFAVLNWNAAGSGGAGALSLVNAGANGTRLHADIPGGPIDVPAHFWLAFSHDLATAPSMGCISTSAGMLFDTVPGELSGSDLSNNLNVNRASHYTLDDSATAWSIGYAPVWGAWEYGLGGAVPIMPHLKVA